MARISMKPPVSQDEQTSLSKIENRQRYVMDYEALALAKALCVSEGAPEADMVHFSNHFTHISLSDMSVKDARFEVFETASCCPVATFERPNLRI